jgi:hypothetical protein
MLIKNFLMMPVIVTAIVEMAAVYRAVVRKNTFVKNGIFTPS